jgi:hypothetical protein
MNMAISAEMGKPKDYRVGALLIEQMSLSSASKSQLGNPATGNIEF